MDYIEEYQKAFRQGFDRGDNKKTRDNFYTNAKIDVKRAIEKGQIYNKKYSLYDIIEGKA
jgi:hypothetical protein|tara:strand:+ start:1967 stop:2146 length:180 start_codon:yes stop_codon:yes gene_type:complete